MTATLSRMLAIAGSSLEIANKAPPAKTTPSGHSDWGEISRTKSSFNASDLAGALGAAAGAAAAALGSPATTSAATSFEDWKACGHHHAQ